MAARVRPAGEGGRAPLAGSRLRVLAYFAAIGLAFMFIEIAFIQKFVLFLSHPLYAVAVVLFSFLLFAGIGSAASQAIAGTRGDGSHAARRDGGAGRRPLRSALPRCASLALSARDGTAGRRADPRSLRR